MGSRTGMGSEEILAPSGVRTLEHPGHRQCLYRPTVSLIFFSSCGAVAPRGP